jgi:serine protease Do
MAIHKIGLSGRGLAVAGVLGLLVVTTPGIHGQQAASPWPHEDLLAGSPFGSGLEIGVSVRDVTADDGAGATRAGAVVESVRGESPAAKSGVQAGDIVVTYDGESVRSARQLARLIDETPQNKPVPLTITRSGKRVDLSVTPQTRQPWAAALAHPTPFPRDYNFNIQPRLRGVTPGVYFHAFPGRLGVQTQDLTDQLGEYFGASNGVLVTSVGDNTPARTAGLRAGDVITKIDGQSVEDTAALQLQLARKTGSVALTVMRDRSERTINVDVADGSPRVVAPRRYER